MAKVATKLKGELKYHVLHANTLVKQLGNATAESISRLQQSLNFAFPYALGMFEQSPYEADLQHDSIFPAEVHYCKPNGWKTSKILLSQTQLHLPDTKCSFAGLWVAEAVSIPNICNRY